MSKELEEIKTLRGFNRVELNNDENVNKSLDIIEQALQRLESIDNAEPSEALELLGFMGNFIIPTALGNKHLKDFCDKEFAIIKQALLKAQKEHKALEIIKEKNVDIRWIEVCDTVKDYNKGRDEHLNYELTKEEFNLLKEVLE